jgi:DNA polymerase sigma
MPTLRAPGTSRCKYETNAAFGRRRIPYVSSEVLERPPEEPKKTLDPHEDEKLSGDMRELYDRLLPGADSTERRKAFVRKVENILHTEWPGNEFKVHVFGSSGNLLYTSESDGEHVTRLPISQEY